MAEFGNLEITLAVKEIGRWRLKLAAWLLKGYRIEVSQVRDDE